MAMYAASGAEFDVNSTYSRSQTQSDSSQLADGSAIVVWLEADIGTTANQFLKAQIYGADGTPTGVELTLSTAGGVNPSVAGLADGGFVVTWQTFSGIKAQIYSADGTAVTPAFQVSPTGAESAGRPDVAALADGGFAISWEDSRTSGGDASGSGVHIRAFDQTGTALPESQVNVATAGNQADSTITALPDGGYLVTWTDRGLRTATESPPWLIKGRFFDSSGVPTGSEFVVNATTEGASSVESSVTVLANGNIAVAWYGSDGSSSGHRIQIIDSSGQLVGDEIIVTSGLSGTQVGPEIVGLEDGGFALAWTANSSPLSDGSGKAVFVQIFDAGAQPLGEPMLANTQSFGDQLDPSIVALSGRGFMVTWTDFGGTGGDDDQVKAQVFVPVEPVTITSDGGGDQANVTIDEFGIMVTQVAAEAGGSSDGIHYAIVGGEDAALFRIDPDTGEIGFASAPDFEAPADADGDNLYEVEVRADNGFYLDTQLLTVAVQNVNERPVITSDGGGTSASLKVAENDTAVTTVIGSDPDGDEIHYRILPSDDFALFQIDGATGLLTFVAAPDYEAPANGFDNFYTVTVEVTDGTPGTSAFQTIQVEVTNVNEAPVLAGGTTLSLTQSENVAAVTTISATDVDGPSLVYAITGGNDAGLFAINGDTGALSFVNAPDFEAPADFAEDNFYTLTVSASDGTNTVEQRVEIAVTNTNEGVTITSGGGGESAAVNVSENGSAVTSVAATDVDGDAVTYSIVGGEDADRFTINAVTGAIAFLASPDFEAAADADHDNVYELVVQASDGSLTDQQTLNVSVTNLNEGPQITSGGALAVDENATSVATITALDPEGQALTYTISGGADASRFVINQTTGALSFVSAPNFEAPSDAGGNNMYDVQVTVSDGVLTDTQALAVSVTNVVDGVTLTGTNGANTLNGTVAEDTLRGMGGGDTLNGGAGADVLEGGAGNDTLNGGLGADRLVGGDGADRFAFSSAGESQLGASDVIADFSRTQKDKISLADIDANANLGGDQKFAFIGSSAFTGAAGQLRYEQNGGNTYVMGDVNGDGVADFTIQVTGPVTFVSGDFLL